MNRIDKEENRNKLRFDADDIAAVLEEARGLDSQAIIKFIDKKEHPLVSPLIPFMTRTNLMIPREDEEPLFRNTVEQIRSLKAWYDASVGLGEKAKTMLRSIVSENPKGSKEVVMSEAQGYCSLLNALAYNVPFLGTLERLGSLDEEQTTLVSELDNAVNMLVHSANLLFSQEYRNGRHRLDHELPEAVRAYSGNGHGGLNVIVDEFVQVDARANYMLEVFVPILSNVKHHAFKEENDVYKRRLRKNFRREAHISARPENPSAKSGDIEVTIADTGFGMSSSDFEELYERGKSSKPEDEITGHGKGVADALEFVKENGGTMNAETIYGMGSKFKFTIPFSCKKIFIDKEKPPIYFHT